MTVFYKKKSQKSLEAIPVIICNVYRTYTVGAKSQDPAKSVALMFSRLFEALKIIFLQILFFPLKIKVLQITFFIKKFFFSYVPK